MENEEKDRRMDRLEDDLRKVREDTIIIKTTMEVQQKILTLWLPLFITLVGVVIAAWLNTKFK